jgi:hypothetical protein
VLDFIFGMSLGVIGHREDVQAARSGVSQVVGAIILVLGIILAAALAIWVTRWALHMND